jgi:hypothetical protein
MKKTIVAAVSIALALSAAVASAATTYTRDLTIGSTGADVVSLQSTLESKGFLVIPAGTAKGYFGQLTKSALAKYQASAGIAPAAGYFGPITRAHFNAMTGGDDNGNDDGDDNDNGSDGELSGGEGDIEDYDLLGNPSDEDLDEGESKNVIGFEFDAADSDLRVERLEIIASSTESGSESTDPWDYIESATLYYGDDEVASADNLDDEDEWDEESSGDVDNTYTFRFEDIDAVVDEDDTAKFYVEFTAVDNLDSDDEGHSFDIAVNDEGLRVVDAEGIDIYEGDKDDTREVTFEGAESGDLELSSDSDDNEDRTIFVDEDSDTDGVEIMRFTVEANASENMIDELEVTLATTTATSTTLSEVISNLTIEVDGEELSSESVPNGNGPQTVTFEDMEDDFVVAEDEEVEVVIYADIVEQEGNFGQGYSFQASVLGAGIEAEDAEGDDVTVTDNVTGGDIELRVDGMVAEFVSADADETFTADDAGERDRGTYTIRFEVTAEGDDVYVGGAYYTYSSTTQSTASSDFDAVGGSYDEETNTWRVDSGNTAEFELTVQLTAATTSSVSQRVSITGIQWDDNDAASTTEVYTQDLEDFKTNALFLGGI